MPNDMIIYINNNAIEHRASTHLKVEHGKLLIPSLFPQDMHITENTIMNIKMKTTYISCTIY